MVNIMRVDGILVEGVQLKCPSYSNATLELVFILYYRQ
jgi:hypothetical protein